MMSVTVAAGVGETQGALLKLLLRNKSGCTIEQIVDHLRITRTAVTQHLNALLRDGYVTREAAVATGGRPSAVWRLNERGAHLFPKHYDFILPQLFDALVEEIGEDKSQRVLDRLGRGLGAGLAQKLEGSPLKDRIPEITAAMEDLGFDAVAADEGAPEIKAFNCVYHSLAKAYPQICTLDLAFLSEASDAEVEHVCCMAKGANECRFLFKRRKGEG